MRLCLVFIILLVSLDSTRTEKGQRVLNDYIRHYEELNYDVMDLHNRHQRAKRSANRSLEFEFSAFGKNFHLDLWPSDSVFAHDHKSRQLDGTESHVDTSFIYDGTVRGVPGSRVHGAIVNGQFQGLLMNSQEEVYFIEPASRYFRDPTPHGHPHSVIYRKDHVDLDPYRYKRASQGHHWYCGLDKYEELMTSESQTAYDDSRTSQDEDHSKDSTTASSRRKRATCYSDPKRTCNLYLRADPVLFNETKNRLGSATSAINEILALFSSHVFAINNIFINTKFETFSQGTALKSPCFEGMNFRIKRTTIMTDESLMCNTSLRTSAFSFCNPTIDPHTFLNIHALDNHDDFCLAYVFTSREFSGRILGLAWVGSPNQRFVGGVCARSGMFQWQGSKVKKSLNAGFVSLTNYGQRVPPRVSQITFAHEVGHNFGSSHDNGSMCAPGGAAGNFIMYPFVTQGDLTNNRLFSNCSKDKITLVLNVVVNNLNGKKNCFTELEESYCGNGIVEKGEECDCGYMEDCTDDCCNPRNSSLSPTADTLKCTLKNDSQMVQCRQCPVGKFGDFCNETCGTGCISGCDRYDGNCTCKPGWQEDICIECEATHYGPDCSRECNVHCIQKTCNNMTGSCTQGCKTGYYGDTCNKSCYSCPEGCHKETGVCVGVCPVGKFGDFCNETCGTGCISGCDRYDGNCTCNTGWREDLCNECEATHYGPDCSRECSVNCIQKTCNNITGSCTQGCKSGFYGDSCNNVCSDCPEGCDRETGVCIGVCPVGKYGDFCNETCGTGCISGCDRYDGNCTCKPGWQEDICNECEATHYGPDCSRECNVHCIQKTCNNMTGSCTQGCKTGYYGDTCNKSCYSCPEGCHKETGVCVGVCPVGKFGDFCNETCGTGCISGCDRYDGNCTCNTGWRKDLCNECEATHYGPDCSRECSVNCIQKTCNNITGSCTQGCRTGFYGDSCNNVCSDCPDGCDRETGVCIGVCPVGKFGDFCNETCGTGCISGCDRYYGNCTCKPGWQEDICNECEATHYGPDCSRECNVHCIQKTCNNMTGSCTQGCKTGYYGDTCNKSCYSCPEGCHKETGVCVGVCPVGKFGDFCNETCGTGCISGCDRYDGNCTCNTGWRKDLCNECEATHYGPDCSRECSVNCIQKTCNNITGSCTQGCRTGFYGDSCNNVCSDCPDGCDRETGVCIGVCPVGKFGDFCNETCGTGCISGCDRYYGNCTCKPGWQEDICNECEATHYGPDCSRECNVHCIQKTCNNMTGSCTQGCKTGFYGDSCNNTCSSCPQRCNRSTGDCEGVCPVGKFGRRCEEMCSQTCIGECDRNSGVCFSCIDGKYGEWCNETCGTGCLSGCDDFNGTCTCKYGWEGDRCLVQSLEVSRDPNNQYLVYIVAVIFSLSLLVIIIDIVWLIRSCTKAKNPA